LKKTKSSIRNKGDRPKTRDQLEIKKNILKNFLHNTTTMLQKTISENNRQKTTIAQEKHL
jgi:hypothetical protein